MKSLTYFSLFFIIGTSVGNIAQNKLYTSSDNMYLDSNTMKLGWFYAYRYCTYRNMHLVDIPSVEERDFIWSISKNATGTSDSIWTSGTNRGTSPTFYWATNPNSTDAIIDHVNGITRKYVCGSENNNRESDCCLSMSEKSFDSLNCNEKLRFVCKKIPTELPRTVNVPDDLIIKIG